MPNNEKESKETVSSRIKSKSGSNNTGTSSKGWVLISIFALILSIVSIILHFVP